MFLCFLFLDGDFGGTVIPRTGGGGGVTPLEGLIAWGRAASQGMFFGIFVLNRVSNLSFFVLIRMSFLGR